MSSYVLTSAHSRGVVDNGVAVDTPPPRRTSSIIAASLVPSTNSIWLFPSANARASWVNRPDVTRMPRGRPAVYDDAEKFPRDRHADAPRPPVLALDQRDLARAGQFDVHAAVTVRAADHPRRVTVAAVRLGDQALELLPGQVADGADAGLPVEPRPARPLVRLRAEPGDHEAGSNMTQANSGSIGLTTLPTENPAFGTGKISGAAYRKDRNADAATVGPTHAGIVFSNSNQTSSSDGSCWRRRGKCPPCRSGIVPDYPDGVDHARVDDRQGRGGHGRSGRAATAAGDGGDAGVPGRPTRREREELPRRRLGTGPSATGIDRGQAPAVAGRLPRRPDQPARVQGEDRRDQQAEPALGLRGHQGADVLQHAGQHRGRPGRVRPGVEGRSAGARRRRDRQEPAPHVRQLREAVG